MFVRRLKGSPLDKDSVRYLVFSTWVVGCHICCVT